MVDARLLYVCVRPQEGAADAEYESFRAAMRLDAAQLGRHDLVRTPFTPAVFDDWSGFVIGGSPFNVTDPESAKTAAQRAVEAGLERIAAHAVGGGAGALFTCYGIGVVTRMLGGQVSRAHPEDAGAVGVELSAEGARDRLFGTLATRFTALTAHKEGSADVPPTATLLATGDRCAVQAYRVGDRLYATQFHPEPTTRAFTERMAIYRDDGYFDAGDFDATAARVLAASVTEPLRLLHAFARTFSG